MTEEPVRERIRQMGALLTHGDEAQGRPAHRVPDRPYRLASPPVHPPVGYEPSEGVLVCTPLGDNLPVNVHEGQAG